MDGCDPICKGRSQQGQGPEVRQRRAETMEQDLRNFVTGQFGLTAWQDIIRIQGQLRTAKIAETRRKAQQVETIITWALALAIAILFFGVIVFVADAVL